MGVSAEVQMAQYAGKFACYPHCLPPTDGAVTRLGEEVPEDTCIDVGVPTNDARATVAQPPNFKSGLPLLEHQLRSQQDAVYFCCGRGIGVFPGGR